MKKRKAMKLLKEALNEIPRLRELPDKHNEEFKLWRINILDVIEKAFGKDSSEYKRIPVMPIETLTFQKTGAQKKQEYNDWLDKYETALKSIIKKYEKTGFESMPVATCKKIGHFVDYLWQVTVKAAFEGIVNGLKNR